MFAGGGLDKLRDRVAVQYTSLLPHSAHLLSPQRLRIPAIPSWAQRFGSLPRRWRAPVVGAAACLLLVLLHHLATAAVKPEEPPPPPFPANHWMKFPPLHGFDNGLDWVVPLASFEPEYPYDKNATRLLTNPYDGKEIPVPDTFPFRPHRDDAAASGPTDLDQIAQCYLDDASRIPIPDIYAYKGVPQGQPAPIFGSHEALGLREDICFDRYGRYGAYGWGQQSSGDGGSIRERETGQGSRREPPIDFKKVDWGHAQDRCLEKNKRRFPEKGGQQDAEASRKGRRQRQAIVLRIFTGYEWSAAAILNIRALVSEAALQSGMEYTVHMLLHVRDNNLPIWTDNATAQEVLDRHIPREFHGLCTLWSESQVKLYYPGDFGKGFDNPNGGPIHGALRSAHMALQLFAVDHPEYDHFWNWEMDVRYVGSFYELFDRLGRWAEAQPRELLWERSERYYIPALHGDWQAFSRQVEKEMAAVADLRPPISGPVSYPGQNRLELPRAQQHLPAKRGGEPADLIALNPIFDPQWSDWVFQDDVTGYDMRFPLPRRRAVLVTPSRLSARLLRLMHEENWRLRHTMFTEMFPAAVALHYGLKAAFAPHPVYVDRAWPLRNVSDVFNGGEYGTAGGRGSPFALINEHNHKGLTWYYNAEFSGRLWRHWLGTTTVDDVKVPDAPGPATGKQPCLRSMLVHPIKWEH